MDKLTRARLQLALVDALKEGVSFADLLLLVHTTAVDWALLESRGNQTEAAIRLCMGRDVVRKYAKRKGVPMGGRSTVELKCQDQRKTSSK